jgi:TM2 domain-containing membrane protein YozV/RNA polymerase subunit RPABC4/transcription elongation factor Spt4
MGSKTRVIRKEATMFCRNCGENVNEKAIACPKCGVPPMAENKFCHNCGKPTQPNQVVCTQCGVGLAGRGSVAGSKSKVAAGLLGIFLGALGIHKFYLGYSKEGLIMLGVCIVGSFAFWLGPIAASVIGLIEGIIYLAKSDEQFDLTYVRNRKPWF